MPGSSSAALPSTAPSETIFIVGIGGGSERRNLKQVARAV